ncbi:hypothetical protein [Metallosphaera yellowstonensis]|nr:hypothetical protein [Metallosphaera yellowstonensis]
MVYQRGNWPLLKMCGFPYQMSLIAEVIPIKGRRDVNQFPQTTVKPKG